MPIAFALWAIGALVALVAAFPTLRYWDGPADADAAARARCPLLTVSFFLTAALIGVLLV